MRLAVHRPRPLRKNVKRKNRNSRNEPSIKNRRVPQRKADLSPTGKHAPQNDRRNKKGLQRAALLQAESPAAEEVRQSGKRGKLIWQNEQTGILTEF